MEIKDIFLGLDEYYPVDFKKNYNIFTSYLW